MKTITFLFIFLFSFSGFFIVESDTFGRLFRQDHTIYSVQQTYDGGFVLGLNKKEKKNE